MEATEGEGERERLRGMRDVKSSDTTSFPWVSVSAGGRNARQRRESRSGHGQHMYLRQCSVHAAGASERTRVTHPRPPTPSRPLCPPQLRIRLFTKRARVRSPEQAVEREWIRELGQDLRLADGLCSDCCLRVRSTR